VGVWRLALLRHIRQQQLKDHLLRFTGSVVVTANHHVFLRSSAAGWRKDSLTFDFDDAGSAVAIRPQSFHVAEVRDFDTGSLCGLKDGFPVQGSDFLSV
jgi:hypothetical protein